MSKERNGLLHADSSFFNDFMRAYSSSSQNTSRTFVQEVFKTLNEGIERLEDLLASCMTKARSIVIDSPYVKHNSESDSKTRCLEVANSEYNDNDSLVSENDSLEADTSNVNEHSSIQYNEHSSIVQGDSSLLLTQKIKKLNEHNQALIVSHRALKDSTLTEVSTINTACKELLKSALLDITNTFSAALSQQQAIVSPTLF
jgi:hypothetical protein